MLCQRSSLSSLRLSTMALVVLLACACGSNSSSEQIVADGDTEAEREPEAPTVATRFLVGYAQADITPPNGVVLGAYGAPGGGRTAEGMHDALLAQVAVFSNDANQSFILITSDLAGYFYEYGDWNNPAKPEEEAPGVREVRIGMARALKDVLAIAPEQILITASHSHAAPDLIGFFQKTNRGPDKAYLRSVRDAMIAAVKEAAQNRKDAQLYFGKTELVGLSGDDRGCYKGAIDNSVNLMQARDGSGKVLFTVVNYAKHPTTQGADNRLVSADWIWGLRSEIAKSVEGRTMYIQGPEAAIHAGPKEEEVGGENWDFTYNVGKAVAQAVLTALPTLTAAKDFEILSRNGKTSCVGDGGLLLIAEQYFKVPKRSITPIYADGDADDDAAVKPVPIAYRINEIEVSWHKLGPAEFAVFPGEPSPAYGLLAKSHMASPYRFAVAFGNDALGYMVDPDSLANDPSIGRDGPDDKGQLYGYEVTMGMGEGGGPCVWEAVTALGWFDGAYKSAR